MWVKYIEKNPDSRFVHFGGHYINLTTISKDSGISHSHLSLIFKGKRNPSYATLRILSRTMGMTIDEFTTALDNRKDDLVSHALALQMLKTANI